MILDLFAGPGGWDEGVRGLGIEDVLGLEWDEAACLTREAAGHRTIRCDVSAYPVEPFEGRVQGLIASPPCQAWSMAGKGAGRNEVDRVHEAVEACRGGWTTSKHEWEDERTPLILEPLRWADALRPEWIAMEQVPPALPVWKHMADVLRGWGYSADARILCAADYGVPQTRNRAYLIASKHGVTWPEPTHAKNPEPGLFGSVKPWVTMAEALGWGITDGPSGVVLGRNEGGGPRPLIGGTGSKAKYQRAQSEGRWAYNRPSTAVCADPRIFKPEYRTGTMRAGTDAIRVELWEAAVLQGFPRNYPFQGSKTKRFSQVGNAVCPPMAKAIIRELEAT